MIALVKYSGVIVEPKLVTHPSSVSGNLYVFFREIRSGAGVCLEEPFRLLTEDVLYPEFRGLGASLDLRLVDI